MIRGRSMQHSRLGPKRKWSLPQTMVRAHVVHVVSTAPVVHAVHAADVNVGVDVNTTINSVSPSVLAMAVPRLHTTLHPPYSTRVSRNLDTRWV